jgi:hypothetical protein
MVSLELGFKQMLRLLGKGLWVNIVMRHQCRRLESRCGNTMNQPSKSDWATLYQAAIAFSSQFVKLSYTFSGFVDACRQVKDSEKLVENVI